MVTKSVEYYMGLPYTVQLRQTLDEGWFAHVREWPGCMTQADTMEAAVANLKDVIPLWLEGALESGYDIPEPGPSDYSGRFMVRVPQSLHRRFAELAEIERVSLNQLVNVALSNYAGRDSAQVRGDKLGPGLTRYEPRQGRRWRGGSMRVLKEESAMYATLPTGKYGPLHRKLQAIPSSEQKVSFTFESIEGVIGDKLPPSARRLREWWSNHPGRHVQAHAWLDAGWKVETVNWSTETVEFVRS